jgi:zinc/manganese transport system permease protein
MTTDLFLTPFSEFSFMRRALAGCVALSIGGTPIGVFLILRRMSLAGDAMAHGILPGIAFGFLFAGLSLGAMTIGGVIAGLTVALLAGFASRRTVLREDATLAAFYLISLALGVLIVSTRGGNVDLLHVLFGTVLALDDNALFLMGGIATLSLIAFGLIYRPLVYDCVNPEYLRTVSPKAALVHYVFLVLVVLNLVGGFNAVGSLMAIGIMILPAASARFWSQSIPDMTLTAMVMSVAGSALGLLVSYHYALPSGPAIILAFGIIYVLSLVAGPFGTTRRPYTRRRGQIK